jgi:hypothetical protein
VQQAYAAVALLIEMLADDHALRHRPARELVTALIRVGAAGMPGAPSAPLGVAGDGAVMGDTGMTARVERLLTPPPGLPLPAQALVCAAATVIVVIPAALLVLPI